MFEDISKKRKWSWNSCNSKHGDEIGVDGWKLKLSSIGIEIHSPLPPEWKQCLDLQVFSKIQTMLFYIDVIVTKISMYLNLQCD